MRITKNRATTVAGAGAVVLLSVAGAAYAASMTVNSSSLGAGRGTVAACQTGDITTSFVHPTDVANTGAGWNVTGITLSNVSVACQSKTIYVSLGNGTVILGSGSVANPAAATFRVPITGTVQAKDVTSVDILIPG